jgi:hypothetical protein
MPLLPQFPTTQSTLQVQNEQQIKPYYFSVAAKLFEAEYNAAIDSTT